MASKRKVAPFEYLFKLVADPETQKPMLKITKTLDGDVHSEYSLRGDIRGGGRCDCPATMRSGAAACKHVSWGRRYMAIADKPDIKVKLEGGSFIYYENEHDQFHLNSSMSSEGLSALTE
jgi:hypothetical protein